MWCSLAFWLVLETSRSRSSGSSMSVPNRENIVETLLLPEPLLDFSRTDTGTEAISEVSGSSPRSSR